MKQVVVLQVLENPWPPFGWGFSGQLRIVPGSMADGSIAFLRASCISMVHAVAAAVYALDYKAADHDLDIEHLPYLLCVASTYPWAAVVGS